MTRGSKYAKQRWLWLICVTLIGAGAIWFTASRGLNPMRGLHVWWANTLTVEGPRAPHREDLALVGIDLQSMSLDMLWPEDIESSQALQEIKNTTGGWPWPRSVHAEVVQRLLDAGAKAVFVDLLFPASGEGDEAMAEVLANNPGRVFIGASIEEISAGGKGNKAVLSGPPQTICATPEIFERSIAVVNFFPGTYDSVIRGYKPYVRATQDERVIYPTFAGRALEVMGKPIPDEVGRRSIPMLFTQAPDEAVTSTYHIYPVYEILADAVYQANFVEPGVFQDKIVVYGPTAPTFQDFHTTPFGSMLGPRLHLQAINAALEQAHFRMVSMSWMVLTPWLAGVLILVSCRYIQHVLLRSTLICVLVGGAWLLAVALYRYFNVMIDATPFVATLLVVGVGTLVIEIVFERLERARTRGFLERYVSKDVANYLLESPEDFLATMRKPVTCLFSDVRGFTTLTETGDPEELVQQLNEYLRAMVAVVHQHHGTLDKFIGDAVMAVWGHPQTKGVKEDAINAVGCAVDMLEKLEELNMDWQLRGMNPWRIGIGVNSGEKVIVGNMGSEEKMELTVIGDAINLAARLESATKQYGQTLLIGEKTAEHLDDLFVMRPADYMRVKGKDEPVEVFAVTGRKETVDADTKQRVEIFEDAIRHYKQMDFATAKSEFERVLEEDEEDRLAEMYVERCAEYLVNPPPANWDGVTTLTSK